jgi:spermidine synthase
VLIVGLGAGGTAYASGAVPSIEHVHVVEINSAIYTVMQEVIGLGGKMQIDRPFTDPRFERSTGDARHFLFTTHEKFDVIEEDPIAPHDSFSGLLYSVEYFQQIRARLNPGGLCVQWVPLPRIRDTFLSVFPYVVRIGKRMIGSNQPIPFDRAAFEHRLREPDVLGYLTAAGGDPDGVMKELPADDIQVFGPGDPRPTDVDRDLFPKDEFYLNQTRVEFPSLSSSQ